MTVRAAPEGGVLCWLITALERGSTSGLGVLGLPWPEDLAGRGGDEVAAARACGAIAAATHRQACASIASVMCRYQASWRRSRY
jgi:hypothetical protein